MRNMREEIKYIKEKLEVEIKDIEEDNMFVHTDCPGYCPTVYCLKSIVEEIETYLRGC